MLVVRLFCLKAYSIGLSLIKPQIALNGDPNVLVFMVNGKCPKITAEQFIHFVP